MSPELQIIVTFAVFLVLLTCGMAVPFAIAVPALFYLLLQGGLPALNSLGLVSWGSMNSFVLTCVPLFMLMAEILRVSGLSSRIYTGLAKLVARLAGGRGHAWHFAAAEFRHDRLWDVYRNLSAEVVHGRSGAGPRHDRGLHGL